MFLHGLLSSLMKHPIMMHSNGRPCGVLGCNRFTCPQQLSVTLVGALHVTGAGKTFTMSGNSASYEQRGLLPRVLAALLSSLRSTPGLSSWSLSLSYLEVRTELQSTVTIRQYSTALQLHGAVQQTFFITVLVMCGCLVHISILSSDQQA